MKRYSDSVADNTLLVSQNVTNLMNDIRAEDLLNDAVYYIDARDASASGQTIDNLGTAKELLPTTLGSSTSADSNDPKFLDHTGTNYIYTPGVGTNTLTIPDSNALDVTGDFDLRLKIAMDDWTPAAETGIINKYGVAGQISWALNILTTGALKFFWSADGTNVLNATSSVATGIADGADKWIRATLDVDNGASGRDVKFFTSDDGTTWTQLGTTQTSAGVTSIFASTTQIVIAPPGKIYRAQIFNGIDGTKVLDMDTSVITAGSATSFTAVTGQTVTINRSTSGRKSVAVTQPTWLFGTDDYMEVNNRWLEHTGSNYLYLPGVFGNSASTPDSAALDITGDIDVRFKLAMDDWTPSAINDLFGKTGATADAYRLRLLTTGALRFIWVESGGTSKTVDSTVALTVTDGAVKWIRVTLDVDNGASGNDVKFYTSDDGTSWTQLGTTVTTAGVTDIRATAANLFIGSYYDGNVPSRGKFFRAQVLNGIDGTVAFDANFETSITSLLQTTFTESSTNAATVTINRSGSTYRSAGITAAGYLYPGATNTFSASATDFLNFGLTDSFTLLAVVRGWNTLSFGQFINKSVTIGYRLNSNNGLNPNFSIQDGTGASPNANAGTAMTSGGLSTLIGVRDVVADRLYSYNNNSVASTTDTTIRTITDLTTALRIGRSNTGGDYQDMELIGAAVFRRALTSAEITLITNYFNRRSL